MKDVKRWFDQDLLRTATRSCSTTRSGFVGGSGWERVHLIIHRGCRSLGELPGGMKKRYGGAAVTGWFRLVTEDVAIRPRAVPLGQAVLCESRRSACGKP